MQWTPPTKHATKTIELQQALLIDKIIKTIAGNKNSLHSSSIPVAKELLHKDDAREEGKHVFNYCQGIRLLTYLQGTSRPDIAMPIHQCDCFSANSKHSHEMAVMKIVCYLNETEEKDIIL